MNAERPDDPPATVIQLRAAPSAQRPAWASRLTEEGWRGLTPLFWTHVNPYGRFSLDVGGSHGS